MELPKGYGKSYYMKQYLLSFAEETSRNKKDPIIRLHIFFADKRKDLKFVICMN